MRDLIMFVDTGIDDSVALILSAMDKNTKLKWVVTCHGNTTLSDVTIKTLQVLNFIEKRGIPVFKGYSGKFSKFGLKSEGFHGPRAKLEGCGDLKAKSFENFLEEFSKLKRKVDILCIAPLTSVAKLLKHDKSFKDKIGTIYFQGGLLKDPSYQGFNVGYDSKAVQIVLDSGLKFVICPSDWGHKAYLNKKEQKLIREMNSTGIVLNYVFQFYFDRDVPKGAIATHDGCASFLVAHPECFELKKSKVFLNYENDACGILNFDFKSKDTNALVCTKMNIKKFKEFVLNTLQKSK